MFYVIVFQNTANDVFFFVSLVKRKNWTQFKEGTFIPGAQTYGPGGLKAGESGKKDRWLPFQTHLMSTVPMW